MASKEMRSKYSTDVALAERKYWEEKEKSRNCWGTLMSESNSEKGAKWSKVIRCANDSNMNVVDWMRLKLKNSPICETVQSLGSLKATSTHNFRHKSIKGFWDLCWTSKRSIEVWNKAISFVSKVRAKRVHSSKNKRNLRWESTSYHKTICQKGSMFRGKFFDNLKLGAAGEYFTLGKMGNNIVNSGSHEPTVGD